MYTLLASFITLVSTIENETAATQTNPEMAAERRIELVGGELVLDRCDAVEKVPGVTEAPWEE